MTSKQVLIWPGADEKRLREPGKVTPQKEGAKTNPPVARKNEKKRRL